MAIHDSSGRGSNNQKSKLSRIDYENEHAGDEHIYKTFTFFF